VGSQARLPLLPTDRVGLARGVARTRHGLHDVLAGSRYQLNPSGRRALQLMEGASLGEAALAMARTFGIPPRQAEADLGALVAELDEHALLEIRRLRGAFWRLAARDLAAGLRARDWLGLALCEWLPLRSPARRRPATVVGIFQACAQGFGASLLGVALAVTLALGVIQAASPAPDQGAWLHGWLVVVKPAAVLVLFLLLAVIHELGHLLSLRLLGIGSVRVVARRFDVGLLHLRLSGAALWLLATSGPLTAAGAGLSIAYVVANHPVLAIGLHPADAVLPLLLAGLHLLSLAPFGSDGRLLRGLGR